MNTENRVGNTLSGQGVSNLQSVNPITQQKLSELFSQATEAELQRAVEKAYTAWKSYKDSTSFLRAKFLRCIAQEIENNPDLIARAMLESGLPEARLVGERGRTCGQLRLFATLLEEGSWQEATIETAVPDRTPLPKEDIRSVLQAIGPVVVFGASNFPLAFSTAGGDTAAALAAGCPVIVKAHNSHLGTHAIVSDAILKAAAQCDMPDGVFSALQGEGNELGKNLVLHPKVKAVAFTGSLAGGMALYRLAIQRKDPIPVFAEMGSINPIFVLSQAAENNSELPLQIAASINLGSGQFCTNPGLIVLQKSQEEFLNNLQKAFSQLSATTMLNEGIYKNYERCLDRIASKKQVTALYRSQKTDQWVGGPALLSTSAENFLVDPELQDEIFGPCTLVVLCDDDNQLEQVANSLDGQLTGTLFGTEEDLKKYHFLYHILTEKVGRVIFNGVPTGVEVCHAMQHGGPFPASTDSRFTSVGTGAIKRFVRPISFQNCPEALLPSSLKKANPNGIWRRINGTLTQEKG